MGDDSSTEDFQVKSECMSDEDTDDETSKTKKKEGAIRNPFSKKEDVAIIKYISQNKRYRLTGGNLVWKEAENDEICPGRSFWSLKERFRKHILNNLDSYKLSDELKKKLRKEIPDEDNEERKTIAELMGNCEQKEYTKAEDNALIQFFAANDEDFAEEGHKLWKAAEEFQICPGRSFWSMRERFLKHIVPNIKSYKCDEKDKKKIRSKRYDQMSEMSKNYIVEEDVELIKYICEGKRFLDVNGLKVWQDAEKKKICPGRSFWSMKGRFQKVILPNLIRYNLDEEKKEKLHFLVHATANDIMLKRQELKRKQALEGLKNYLHNSNNSSNDEVNASDSSPELRKSGRFRYPPISEQRTLESPMGRVSEISIVGKTSPKKTKNIDRDKSPKPCCSKDLSPVKKTTMLSKKTTAKNSPKKGNKKLTQNIANVDKNPMDVESEPEETFESNGLSPNINLGKTKAVNNRSKKTNEKLSKRKAENNSPKKTNRSSPEKKAKKDENPTNMESEPEQSSESVVSDGSEDLSPSKNLKEKKAVNNRLKKTNDSSPKRKAENNSPKKTNESSLKKKAKKDKNPTSESEQSSESVVSDGSEDLSPNNKLDKRRTVNSNSKKTNESFSHKRAKNDKNLTNVESEPEESSESIVTDGSEDLSPNNNLKKKKAVNNRLKKTNESAPKRKAENNSLKKTNESSPKKKAKKDKNPTSESEQSAESVVSDGSEGLSPNNKLRKRRSVNNSPRKTSESSPERKAKNDKNSTNVESEPEEPSESIVITDGSEDLSPNNNLKKKKAVNSRPKKTNESSPKRKAENNIPKKTKEASPEKKTRKGELAKMIDRLKKSSEADIDKTRPKKIVPFFEEMKRDERKMKIVTSTPKKSPNKNSNDTIKKGTLTEVIEKLKRVQGKGNFKKS